MSKNGSRNNTNMFQAQTMALAGGYPSITIGGGKSYQSQVRAWENSLKQSKRGGNTGKQMSQADINQAVFMSKMSMGQQLAWQKTHGVMNFSGIPINTTLRSGEKIVNKPTGNLTGAPIYSTGNSANIKDLYSNLTAYDRTLLSKSSGSIWALLPSGNVTGVPEEYVTFEKGIPVAKTTIPGYAQAGSIAFDKGMPYLNPNFDVLNTQKDNKVSAPTRRPSPSLLSNTGEKLSSDTLASSDSSINSREAMSKRRLNSNFLFGKTLLGE